MCVREKEREPCSYRFLWRPEEDVRSLVLELQAFVNYLMWVLGIELKSSEEH